jgi:RNA polymerase sigma factor (sigma-70 family)
LIEASRRGEREAFGLLVSRYQDVVCAVSFSSTGNWALSQDVAQDTFIAAWRQLGQLREVRRLRPWLCGIARNLARKARRRTDRESSVEDDALPAADANPFDAAAQAEVDRVVREALARIPEAYRETLVLYYCENRSVREVAAVLGVSEDAAMQRLTRGRRYLASGFSELVERSLRGARPRKGLVAAVMAALPVATVSRVDASPRPEGSTMLKIGIAAAIFVAAGTTAFVTQRSGSTPSHAAKAAVAAPTPVAVTGTEVRRPPAQTPRLDKPVLPLAAAAAPQAHAIEPPRLIGKDTIAQLHLDQGPSRGPADAPVTIIVFQDVLCTYCSKVLATIDQLWDDYPGQLRLVVKQFPVHEQARLAAEASLAADAQGKFWELHDVMMGNQQDLSRDAIVAYAQQAGLDVASLATALDQHTYASALAAEIKAASDVGIHATPTFLINGQEVRGAVPADMFRDAIDQALVAAQQ